MIRPLLLLFALAPPTIAQSLRYYAGTPGSPQQAPSPVAQGFSETITGNAHVSGLSPDDGGELNAWQVNDPDASSHVLYRMDSWYYQSYDVVVVMKPLAGSILVKFDTGDLITDSLFEVELELVGSDVLVHRVNGAPLACAGAADGEFHEFRFSGYLYGVDFFYDGVNLGDVSETQWGLYECGAGLRFGTFPDKPGRARFNRVEMIAQDWGPIGVPYCGPAVAHSAGVPGRILAEGYAVVGRNDVRLTAYDLPPDQFGYFLVSATPGFSMPAGSQGNLCLSGNIGRYNAAVASSGPQGSFWLDLDLTNVPTNPPQAIPPGETWSFQAWFRDFNPGPTSNFTDGRRVQF